MADTAPVMIWVSDPNKLRTFVNKRWLSFTGRTIEQELGNGWRDNIHPGDRDKMLAAYCDAFDACRSFEGEWRLRRADGEYRSLLCSAVPRFQEGGVFVGYIGTCHDITDMKRAQEKAIAGQKLEDMGMLASGIAHDFNNLLGGILAWAEVALTAQGEDCSGQEELLRIKAAALSGAEIVRQLMIYGGTNSPDFEPVDCSFCVSEMLQLLKVSISKYAILKTDLAEDGSVVVHGNPAQIRQLILNLVINGSQAIGSRPGEIRVTTRLLAANETSKLVATETSLKVTMCNWKLPTQASACRRKQWPGFSTRFFADQTGRPRAGTRRGAGCRPRTRRGDQS